ncbi:MAG: respiratory nitrate reductase subunit gamma [candidate division Zixibacteria bacterium]|nr:respiratory nitrate reductase subunit gamma [candidate division Zixibacteria bacterium]
MGVLQILSYLSVFFFVTALAAKMRKIAKMPVHLRWDLYPIPHEKGKGHYGGSYFEEVDWWKKPKNFSMLSELIEMGKEIIFVHSVFKNNRSLWYFSFPFHLGMYSLCAFAGLLIFGAILGAVGIEVSATSPGFLALLVHFATFLVGTTGLMLSALGAIGLLFQRLTNYELHAASVRSDYVNLLFILAVVVAGLVSWATVDPTYAILRGYIQDLITFSAAAPLPGAITVFLWLFVGLMFYFPFTHMTHMVGKYFTYHMVRWEDEPNSPGSEIEKSVTDCLQHHVTWSAPHIKTGGTWAEAATATEEDLKNE